MAFLEIKSFGGNLAAIKFGVSPPPVYAVYDRRIYWRRQILAKTRNSPNSPNIIARQNLLIYSNQLLHFDTLCEEWTNPECFGNIPDPVACPATAIIEDKVWLTGGYSCTYFDPYDDLYELDMHSLVWAKITTGCPYPVDHKCCTLTAITNHQLVLHGCEDIGAEMCTNTWILDLPSVSWTKHSQKITHKDKCSRCAHTCTSTFSGNVLVVGGYHFSNDDDCPDGPPHNHKNIHVMLEPKKLKQLAVKAIYNNRDTCFLENLPKKLSSLLDFL